MITTPVRIAEHPPEARVIQVIEVRFRRGEGIVADPVRRVTAYYSLEGELLAEHDDWANTSFVETGRSA